MALADIRNSDAKQIKHASTVRTLHGVTLTPHMQEVIEKSRGTADPEARAAILTKIQADVDAITREGKEKARALQEEAERQKRENK